MRGVGRRGSTGLMYEIVISLVLLGLFAATAYLYIIANATGEAYYSQFYAADLATSADLVLAGNGDVILRYDNLKPQLDLAFWLTNGKVAVAKSPVPKSSTIFSSAGAKTTATLDMTESPGAATQRYGRAQDYPLPTMLTNPTYLSLRKVDESFSITEADIALEECPAGTPAVPLSDALVWFHVEGLTDEERARAEQAFADTIPKGIRTTAEQEKATVKVEIRRATGDDAIAVAPTGADGARFACVFWRHLGLLTIHEWGKPAVQSSGNAFAVTVTVTSGKDTLIKPEHIGQAAALALARMYGTGGGGAD